MAAQTHTAVALIERFTLSTVAPTTRVRRGTNPTRLRAVATNTIVVAMARGAGCEIAARFGRMQITITNCASPTKGVKRALAVAGTKCWHRTGANT